MKKRNNTHSESGFTLVELAIVLVVIGLLVAIVAAGKTLVEAGKARAAIKEIEDLQSSFIRFGEKYHDLPGDMSDANAYFNVPIGNCPVGGGALPGGSGTGCSGDGNEQISWDTGAGAALFQEGAAAFLHLQGADMLGGEPLSGQGGIAEIGVSGPASTIPNAMWTVDFDATLVMNLLQIGAADGAGLNDGPVLTPKIALSIDSKIDDGFGDAGRIQGIAAVPCMLDDTGGTGYWLYDQTIITAECILRIQLDTAL